MRPGTIVEFQTLDSYGQPVRGTGERVPVLKRFGWVRRAGTKMQIVEFKDHDETLANKNRTIWSHVRPEHVQAVVNPSEQLVKAAFADMADQEESQAKLDAQHAEEAKRAKQMKGKRVVFVHGERRKVLVRGLCKGMKRTKVSVFGDDGRNWSVSVGLLKLESEHEAELQAKIDAKKANEAKRARLLAEVAEREKAKAIAAAASLPLPSLLPAAKPAPEIQVMTSMSDAAIAEHIAAQARQGSNISQVKASVFAKNLLGGAYSQPLSTAAGGGVAMDCYC